MVFAEGLSVLTTLEAHISGKCDDVGCSPLRKQSLIRITIGDTHIPIQDCWSRGNIPSYDCQFFGVLAPWTRVKEAVPPVLSSTIAAVSAVPRLEMAECLHDSFDIKDL